MTENNVDGSIVANEQKKKSKIDIALEKMKKLQAKEKRIDALKAQAEKAAEELRRKKAEKKAAEKAVAEAKKELAAVRSYANVKKEPSNIRKQYGVKGFFDLLDKCNADGSRDFTEAYNFIGDTKWLREAVMHNLMVNTDDNKLEIDIAGLRKEVFEKKKDVEGIIACFKAELESRLTGDDKNKK